MFFLALIVLAYSVTLNLVLKLYIMKAAKTLTEHFAHAHWCGCHSLAASQNLH